LPTFSGYGWPTIYASVMFLTSAFNRPGVAEFGRPGLFSTLRTLLNPRGQYAGRPLLLLKTGTQVSNNICVVTDITF
jgi:hypothetical protein